MDLLRQLFPPNIVCDICKIPCLISKEDDKMIWPFSKDDTYSTKSGYHRMVDLEVHNEGQTSSQGKHENNDLWEIIWKSNVMNKIRAFGWKICNGAIPTKRNLKTRNCIKDDTCEWCDLGKEDIEHLFIKCPLSMEIWAKSRLQLLIDREKKYELGDWLIETRKKCIKNGWDQNEVTAYLLLTLWNIWKAKMKGFHEKSPWVVKDILFKIQSTMDDMFKNRDIIKKSTKEINEKRVGNNEEELIENNPILSDDAEYIFMSDASFKKEYEPAGMAAIAIDKEGKVAHRIVSRSIIRSSIEGECWAVLLAMRRAASCDLWSASFYSDNLELIQGISREAGLRWQISPFIAEMKSWLAKFPNWKINFVNRKFNNVTDLAAKSARRNIDTSKWKNGSLNDFYIFLKSLYKRS